MSTSKWSHPEQRSYQDISTIDGKSEVQTTQRSMLAPATHAGIMQVIRTLLGSEVYDAVSTTINNNIETITYSAGGTPVRAFEITYTGPTWSLAELSLVEEYLLQENGDFLLQENGDLIVL